MPVQAPQWTEVLSCPVCCKEFSLVGRHPVSLSCGHTACRACLSKLHRQQCPFDQTAISKDVDKLPTNYAILQLVAGSEVLGDPSRERIPEGLRPNEFEIYLQTQGIIEELALYLQPLSKAPSTTNSSSSSSTNSSMTTLSSGSSGHLLSRPIQRKLVTLVNCQLVEEEGRARAVRAARSLGERIVTELIIQHQNPQQLSANLWAAVRTRGCQFLGPAMQEETLKLVLLALEDGTPLSRKVLVLFVVQKLEQQFPQASKTSVGHVVQLLYRASCFKVTKRDEESSLMQLKEEFRNYDSLRREHDAQIVQIAIEAGLRISPEQWSSLLYGDLNHKSHMQSIIDKLQTPASFASSIQELTICLQRSGDPVRLTQFKTHLEQLAAIDSSPGAMISSWAGTKAAADAVKLVLQGLVDFMQNFSQNKKALDLQAQNIKFKTSLCRDVMQKGGCPRGPSCTFAHSQEELERYRSKSRQLLSSLNNQAKNQRGVRGDKPGSESMRDLLQSANSSPGSVNEDRPKAPPPTMMMDESSTKSWAGSETRYGSESRYVAASRMDFDLDERTHSVIGFKSEPGMAHRPSGPFAKPPPPETVNEEDLEKAIQARLYGLKKRNQELAIRQDPDSPASSMDTTSLRSVSPPGGSRLPASNARLYAANRGGNLGFHSESSSSSLGGVESDLQGHRSGINGGGNPLPPPPTQAGGGGGTSRLPQQELERGRGVMPYPDDGLYYERRLTPNIPAYRSPGKDSSQTQHPSSPPALQPRILIPTNLQPGLYEDKKAAVKPQPPYPYLTPAVGRYLYPEPVQPPAHPGQRVPEMGPRPPGRGGVYHRRPVVQRYVDPHTMKAYDVVPADDYLEPYASPSLMQDGGYHVPQYRDEYRESSGYYSPYEQRADHPMPRDGRQLPPVGSPLILQPRTANDSTATDGRAPPPERTKAPSRQTAIGPLRSKRPSKMERGPSLTELLERQNYLVSTLDEMHDDYESVSSNKSSNSISSSTSLWGGVMSTGQYSWTSSSGKTGGQSANEPESLWAGVTSPIVEPSSSGLNFSFEGIANEEEEEDNDHRKNGIDVDAEDEILLQKLDETDNETSSQDERAESDQGSYNPWTSTALFMPQNGKAVKETPTNHTYTMSKVLVRHVSTSKNDEMQKAPHGAHNMKDFENMSFLELKRTLMDVEQQDRRAGSSHFERGQKIQIELGRREESDTTSPGPFPDSPKVPPLPAQLVNKDPILHLYTKYHKASHAPIVHASGARHAPFGPVSGSARTMGSNTGPLKISAGAVENTMPVNMTVQDCQVAPGFQTPDGDGYYIKTPKTRPSDELHTCTTVPQVDWEKNVDQLVENDPNAEEKLIDALTKVRTQIQAKETVQHAQNTFILDLEEKALENMMSDKQPHIGDHHCHSTPITIKAEPSPSTPVAGDSRALQLQETQYNREANAHHRPLEPNPHHQHHYAMYPPERRGAPTQRYALPEAGQGVATYAAVEAWSPYTGHHQVVGQPEAGVGARGEGGYPYPYQHPSSIAAAAAAQPQGTVDGRRIPSSSNQQQLVQQEQADRKFAKQVQHQEQQDYLAELEQIQRNQEAKQRQEQQRRLQEDRDRRLASDLALKEAMSRGYCQ